METSCKRVLSRDVVLEDPTLLHYINKEKALIYEIYGFFKKDHVQAWREKVPSVQIGVILGMR